MKPVRTYVAIVDGRRRASRKRSTSGRYLVGAKTEKEAKKILQETIGFGSIEILRQAAGRDAEPEMGHREIVRVHPSGTFTPARHANSPLPK